ncbi:MAG: hypothetical protein RLZ12_4 [Bacillota bacterium]|jgi:hypothetical protein
MSYGYKKYLPILFGLTFLPAVIGTVQAANSKKRSAEDSAGESEGARTSKRHEPQTNSGSSISSSTNTAGNNTTPQLADEVVTSESDVPVGPHQALVNEAPTAPTSTSVLPESAPDQGEEGYTADDEAEEDEEEADGEQVTEPEDETQAATAAPMPPALSLGSRPLDDVFNNKRNQRNWYQDMKNQGKIITSGPGQGSETLLREAALGSGSSSGLLNSFVPPPLATDEEDDEALQLAEVAGEPEDAQPATPGLLESAANAHPLSPTGQGSSSSIAGMPTSAIATTAEPLESGVVPVLDEEAEISSSQAPTVVLSDQEPIEDEDNEVYPGIFDKSQDRK